MAIRLTAQGGQLPLAFQNTHEHLKGTAGDAYLSQGKPLAGEQLDLALAREGYGLHPVRVSGQFSQAGNKETIPWQMDTVLAGQLNSDELARAIHAATRQFIEPYGRGNTPPEVYVTGIQIGTPGFEPTPPKRRKGKRYAAYLDTKTGEYVPRDKYLRSRRSMRGVATRKGLARPRKGRYVRVLLDYNEPNDDAEGYEDSDM